MPLLKLLDSKNGSLQHNAAFALYGLADNEVCINIMNSFETSNGVDVLLFILLNSTRFLVIFAPVLTL